MIHPLTLKKIKYFTSGISIQSSSTVQHLSYPPMSMPVKLLKIEIILRKSTEICLEVLLGQRNVKSDPSEGHLYVSTLTEVYRRKFVTNLTLHYADLEPD